MNDSLLIHAGINYIVSPAAETSRRKGLDFQHFLLEQGIEVAESKYEKAETINVVITDPIFVSIMVSSIGPGVGQLLLVGDRRPGDSFSFGLQADAIIKAYEQTWPFEKHQIIHCDITLRYLYETGEDHAFKMLWEERLGQSEDSLSVLGPVLGGGLRFVTPPTPEQKEPHLTEVKIESFLKDTSRLFVETEFKWEGPPRNWLFNPVERINEVNDYVNNQVAKFIDWRENLNDKND